VICGDVIEYKYTYISHIKSFPTSKVTCIATVGKFTVLSDKVNAQRIRK
jgi:hypothetical protein